MCKKHKINHVRPYPAVVLSLLLFLFSSCAHTKNIKYFEDLNDSTKVYVQDTVQDYEPTIQPGDLLEILVSSSSASASAPFNLGGNAQVDITGSSALNAGAGSAPSNRDYLVNKAGFIDFPVLRNIHVEGLTTAILKDTLEARLNDYLRNTIVNIRILNYKITILGEVLRPATYYLNADKITIIDAIAAAGDLTIYGKRGNILVIRQDHGKRIFARLDLNSSNIFKSPYYFLRQNDLVYVEPNKTKVAASDDRLIRNITIGSGLLAIIISVIYLIK